MVQAARHGGWICGTSVLQLGLRHSKGGRAVGRLEPGGGRWTVVSIGTCLKGYEQILSMKRSSSPARVISNNEW